MSKEAEIRVCKNKKCQKVLPAGYKHKYCEHVEISMLKQQRTSLRDWELELRLLLVLLL